MPWYYAGPEAKPLGPVSAEQLQALHASGTITPDTFVIEHTGAGAGNLMWKRYREVFPSMSPLPPIPFATHPTTIPQSTVSAAPPVPPPGAYPAPHPSTHPLFPSAAQTLPGQPNYGSVASPVGYGHIRPTNAWCAWGFALSLVGFCFVWLCGIGAIPALVALVLCIIGLVQVSKSREQNGLGLAITGLIFSGIALLVAIAILWWIVPPIMKAHGLTVTEQTSNDSE